MEVADLIDEALQARNDPAALAQIRGRVRALTTRYPLPG
jgi:glycine/serine hydroxymethyltransferase